MGGRFGELLLLLIVALLLFGPSKLPDLARAMGEALREFKKAANPDQPSRSSGPDVSPNQAAALPAEQKDAPKKEGSPIS